MLRARAPTTSTVTSGVVGFEWGGRIAHEHPPVSLALFSTETQSVAGTGRSHRACDRSGAAPKSRAHPTSPEPEADQPQWLSLHLSPFAQSCVSLHWTQRSLSQTGVPAGQSELIRQLAQRPSPVQKGVAAPQSAFTPHCPQLPLGRQTGAPGPQSPFPWQACLHA